MKKRIVCMLSLLAIVLMANAKVFSVENPDKKLSPYTGMTRGHWMQAAQYLLEGPFTYVNDLKDPMNLPKQEGKSYPRNEGGVPTSRMEALCRTMFLAGPLLKENPNLTLHGINVGDYYRYQLASFLDKNSPLYLPPHRGGGNGGQKLVELGGLSVSLLLAPDVFWNPLPQQTKDSLAQVFKTYAEGGTIDMNWRFFNMCMLSFLDGQGYKVNTKYLKELLDKNLAAYVGDGWYHDSPLLDYYSMWAFQMYGPLWANSYGKTHFPAEAEQFMNNLRTITHQYPYMFGRDGHMQMWGRSITYRMGAVTPLALTGLLNDAAIDYGWMRRICSGSLLQFLQNPDFMAEDGLPNLGFYGHFENCLQHYSCRGSVFWMAKIFLSLYMPKDSPFWTAKETEGEWKKIKKGNIFSYYSAKAKTLTTNYQATGMAEFRNVFVRNRGFYYGLENYNRFAYNSSLPWQSDGKNGEVAMSYVTSKDGGNTWNQLNTYKNDGGFNADSHLFTRTAEMEKDASVSININEYILPNATTHKDKITCDGEHLVRMGYYALPDVGKGLNAKTITLKDGNKAIVIDNGEWQVATVKGQGWDDIEVVYCTDLHPQAKRSVVVNLKATVTGERSLESKMVVTQSGKKIKWDK